MTSGNTRSGRLFDGSFLFLLALAALTGAAAVLVKGPGAIPIAAEIVFADLFLILPMIALGVVVGTLFTLLVPREAVARHLGDQAGLRGILLAALVGTVMPAGPFAAFPLVLALGRSGAAIGPLIAFLTAWATVGLNRLIIWEIPFMGWEFGLLRFFSTLPLPILAGLLAERLSRTVRPLLVEWQDDK